MAKKKSVKKPAKKTTKKVVEQPPQIVEPKFTQISDILWANDRESFDAHIVMARKVLKRVAAGNYPKEFESPEKAAVYLLSEALKNAYEYYIDDIGIVNSFRRFFFSGHPSVEPRYRQVCIMAMCRYAFENIDWHDFADTIIQKINDTK